VLYGVDVHDAYQAGISFPTLVRQGYSFAVVKLTQGTTFVRDRAPSWIRSARSAGLIPGAYHWLTGSDGAAQARWFHSHLAAAGGPEGLLIQLDCEDDGYGRQMTDWANEWNQLTNYHPFIIYSAKWWWPRTGGFNGHSLTPYLWHGQYITTDANTTADNPANLVARVPSSFWTPGYGGWPRATILQFTDQGDAGGLGNNVDLNATPLSRGQLLALTTTSGEDPLAGITERDAQALIWRVEAILHNRPTVAGGPTQGERNDLHDALSAAGIPPAALEADVVSEIPEQLEL
jgi:GH25 family lysozyme M1 (1,4-beta-N-acetylmuramidase)